MGVLSLKSRLGVVFNDKLEGASRLLFGLLQLFFELLNFLFNLFDLTGNLGGGGSALGRQQCLPAMGATTPARVFGLELRCVRLVNDQAVVVIELFTRLDVAQRFDVDAVILFIGLAVGVAAVIDPARGVAAMQGVNHLVFVHMEVKGMVGVGGVVRVPILRLIPADDLAHVFKQGLAFGNVLQGENAFAVNAGATYLHPTARCW